MGRLAAVLFVVSGTVALQVMAQGVLLTSVRLIGRRTQVATKLRPMFWISLGAVGPYFSGTWPRSGCGLGSSSGSAFSRPTTTSFTSRSSPSRRSVMAISCWCRADLLWAGRYRVRQ